MDPQAFIDNPDPYKWIWDLLKPLGGSLRSLAPNLVPEWRAPSTQQTYWLLIAVAIVLGIYMLRKGSRRAISQQRRAKDDKPKADRPTNTPFWQRLLWRIRPPTDLMRVDGLVIDRDGKRSHALWIGPTGAGKSQSVATVRCNGKRPVFAAMPDLSDPLRLLADFIWTAGESTTPVDFLIGTANNVAMMLTEVFRSGGNGVWKRAAFLATKQVIEAIDAAGELRSLLLIGERLNVLIADDRALKMACEGWVVRFLATAEALGDSAGPGGVDLSELLRQGLNVVVDNDAWKHPGLKGDVVAFGLAEARRCADIVPGGFRLIFEEADQLGDRMDLADPFFTAGRRRLVAVDALVHSEDKLPDAMGTNTATRVYFRPNKPEHRRKVADALDMTEREVDAIPDYHAIIEHDGKIRRLVHFPKPPTSRHSASYKTPDLADLQDNDDSDDESFEPAQPVSRPSKPPGRYEIEVIESRESEPGRRRPGNNGFGTSDEPKSLPAGRKHPPTYVLGVGRERRYAIWDKLSGTWNSHGCHRWLEKSRNGQYGKTSYLNVGGWSTHFLFWAWRVIEDQDLRRSGDLDRFYVEFPEFDRFRWPGSKDELVRLQALRKWMRDNDLTVDHACPGTPDTLCSNWRHLHLVPRGGPAGNSALRWARAKGEYRDVGPSWEDIEKEFTE